MKAGALLKNMHLQSLAGNLLPAVLGLLSFMLLARGLTKADFGSWVLYLSSFSLLEMIKSGGVQTALVMSIAGKKETQKKGFIGAAWKLLTAIALGSGMVFYAVTFFRQPGWNPGLVAFLYWYPLIGIATIPYNISQALLQADHRFDRVLLMRLLMSIGFLGISAVVFWSEFSVGHVVAAHAVLQGICGVTVLVSGWSQAGTVRQAGHEEVREMVRLGKFSFGTLAATNLLKSADTFLIGYFLGSAAVGLYSIPLRLVEVLEIPLRSAVATAFPRFSGLHNTGDRAHLRDAFHQYAGVTFWLFVPVLVGCFVLADYLVLWMGGAEYAASAPVFRVFLGYGLFLPLDRFTGVLLDGLQRPSLNLFKVLVMAGFNILGDVVVLHFFPDLRGVAGVSICNAILGVALGFYMGRRYLDIRLSQALTTGWELLKGHVWKYSRMARKERMV